jgi:hypothetical protein
VIAAALFGSLGYVFRFELLLYWRRLRNYLFDTKVKVELTRVDRYSEPPTEGVDKELFNRLKQELDDVKFEGLTDDYLRISVPGIPTPIEVRIDHQPAMGHQYGVSDRFELQVRTQTPMTFGYRSDQCLRDFEKVAEDISTVCLSRFPKEPKTTFLTGTLYGNAPFADDEIEDEGLGMRAKVREKTLELRFEEPRELTRGIRKYLRPLQ